MEFKERVFRVKGTVVKYLGIRVESLGRLGLGVSLFELSVLLADKSCMMQKTVLRQFLCHYV